MPSKVTHWPNYQHDKSWFAFTNITRLGRTMLAVNSTTCTYYWVALMPFWANPLNCSTHCNQRHWRDRQQWNVTFITFEYTLCRCIQSEAGQIWKKRTQNIACEQGCLQYLQGVWAEHMYLYVIYQWEWEALGTETSSWYFSKHWFLVEVFIYFGF